MTLTRRDWLRLTAGGGAALALTPDLLASLARQEVIARAIPATGEMLPVVGLGSAATFSRVARSEDVSAIRDVLQTFVENGGTVFDTAPGYGASEQVAGDVANELGIQNRIFWATKVNVAGRGGRSADPAAARAQIQRSFDRFQLPVIDLIQVHNLGDPPTQIGILKEEKAAGRVRYIGITSTSERRYPDLAAVMRNEPIDFIGVDYAVDNRASADELLPLAQELNIGVLVYAPFGRTRLWNRERARRARVGRGVRRAQLGAVLPQVHGGAPGGDRGDPRDQPPRAHGGQPGRRHGPPPEREPARAHGPAGGGSAVGLTRVAVAGGKSAPVLRKSSCTDRSRASLAPAAVAGVIPSTPPASRSRTG